MVLPFGDFTLDEEIVVVEEATLPTRTYKLDYEKGRVIGMTDGLDAIEQSIFKRLSTIRFEHLIYTSDYGFENPIGLDEIFVRAEIPRRIEETLLQDERIISLENMTLTFKGDSAWAKFDCITLYGNVNVTREVRSDV